MSQGQFSCPQLRRFLAVSLEYFVNTKERKLWVTSVLILCNLAHTIHDLSFLKRGHSMTDFPLKRGIFAFRHMLYSTGGTEFREG